MCARSASCGRGSSFSTPTAAIFSKDDPKRLEDNLVACGVTLTKTLEDGQPKVLLSWMNPDKEAVRRECSSKQTFSPAALMTVAEAFLRVSLVILHDVDQKASCNP
jgi:hypothetical protein